MKNVHYQQKYECLECGKLFGRPDNLTRHTKVHQGASKASTAANAEISDEAEELSDEGEDLSDEAEDIGDE